MLHIASYTSPLETPPPLTSPAIQSKADARQRVGGNPTIPLNQLTLQIKTACDRYESREPLKKGGDIGVNYDLVTRAIDSLIELLKHSDLPPEAQPALKLRLASYKKKQKDYKRLLEGQRPRQAKKSRPFPSQKLRSLSKKLSSLSQKFWKLIEPPSSFR
jgi:hypothetical protein